MSIGQICNVYTGGEAPSNCVKGPNPTDKYPYAIWANGREVYGYTDSYKIEDDSVCISSIGANTGDVFFHKGKFTPIIRLKVLVPIDKNQLNIRYLYHAMCNHKFDTKKSSVPNMNSDEIKAVIIPVPSIELQNRIAYTLDNFDAICSDLNIGLPAEISARNKQYEYYRDRLLTFNLDVSGDSELVRGGLIKLLQFVFGYIKAPLSIVGKVCMCKRIMKDQTSSAGDVPFYKIGTFGGTADAFIDRDLFNEYRSKYNYPKKGDILISCSGTIGRTVVFDGEDSYFQDSNIVWIRNNESLVTNKYLRYAYQLMPFIISTGGTISRLYNEGIEKAIIKIPSLEKQSEIVDLLDRFDTYCNDLKEGLPAEINARQQQYKYYRDKLLNFKEMN